jgi:hypothetical protein
MIDGAANALRTFGMTGGGIFGATRISDYFHASLARSGRIIRSSNGKSKNETVRMKSGRMIHKKSLFLDLITAGPTAFCRDGEARHAEKIEIKHFKLATGTPTLRVAQMSDIHFRGTGNYLEAAVNKVNALSPDIVCFTGDLIERSRLLTKALAVLEKIKSPIYGIPGNHDYSCGADFNEIEKAFAKTGGALLLDRQVTVGNGKFHLTGVTGQTGFVGDISPMPAGKNILLIHYPVLADQLPPRKYDLILAGHSHGGQVRLPFLGAILLPYGSRPYDWGMYETESGPMYVTSGLVRSIRLNCPPEIAVFEI